MILFSPLKGLEQQGKHDGDTNLFFMGSPRCVSIPISFSSSVHDIPLYCRVRQPCFYDFLKGKYFTQHIKVSKLKF